MKSPTPRSRHSNSPFTKEEQIWIVRNAADKSPITLRREFIIHFKKTNKHLVPRPDAFKAVVKRFDATGGVTSTFRDPIQTVRTPENVAKVAAYFEEDMTRSIREAMHDLGLKFSTIWRILRMDLHWKPYKFKRVQKLSPANQEARVVFCTWVLAKEIGFERKIIFSDEKFFVLEQAPHRQNDR